MGKRTQLLFAVVWSVSIAAAFWIGRTGLRSSAAPAGGNATANAVDEQANASHKASVHRSVGESTRATKPGGGDSDAAQEKFGPQGELVAAWYADKSVPVADRLAALLELDDPLARMTAFLGMLGGFQSNDDFAAAAKALANNFDPRGRGREMSMLMTAWAQRDPQSALKFTEKMEGWQGRYASYSALQAYVKQDPNAARAWALEHGKNADKEEGNWHMLAVVGGLVKSDLDTAVAWAMEQPRSKARGEMMDKLLDGYFKQRGADAAQQWAMGLADGPFREGVLRKTAWRLTENDPATAASWINQLPASEGRTGAMSDLMERWANRDPNAAGTWLRQYPTSAETDEPRRTFAWSIREKDPESAMAWAGTVSDNRQRERIQIDLARDWFRRDPQAAQNFMSLNSWPVESQKRVVGERSGDGRG